MFTKQQRRVALVIALIPTLGLVGCAGAGERAPSSAPAVDGEVTIGPDTDQQSVAVEPHQGAIDLLPADIAEAGTITVGLEANGGYPNSVTIDGTQYGLTLDLARELAATLDLDLEVQSGPFANLIPGLQAGRYDFSSSLYGDSAERREVLDFVYATLGLGDVLLASSSSPEQELTFDKLCGLSIATTTGSAQLARLTSVSTTCTEAGDDPVDIQEFPSNPDTVLAAVSARVDGAVLPLGGGSFAAQANPSKLTLGPIDETIQLYAGIGLPKGSDLTPAIQAAMVNLIESGVWEETLTIYGQEITLPDVSVVELGVPYEPAS